MNSPFIPPATASKLNGAIPKGTRHKAAIEIAVPLIGNGLSPQAVCQILRDKFDEEVTNEEIEKVVQWATDRQPTPSVSLYNAYKPSYQPEKKSAPKRTSIEQATWWLDGYETNLQKFSESSPFKVPTSKLESCRLVFDLLYADNEYVNIVCNFIERDGKANPVGGGKTMKVSEWNSWIKEKGVPHSKAGAWIRPNPCSPSGTGADGSITNSDIASFRFILVESDDLPLDVQLALFSKFKLPISAVILSGGKSAHAWVRVDAKDEKEYYEIGTRLLKALDVFGIDQSNKNPSRLSRLAGAKRTIGAVGDGEQRLLWISPSPVKLTIESLALFESSLLFPVVSERPFQKTLLNAIPRYEEMIANRGKLGVPTGIADFDRDTGGLKGGQMTVIAAETNGGKSSLAINMANTAASRGFGVALFTLEMDRDEICDLIVSMNCRVNRNCFNTGDFSEQEVQRIVGASAMLSNLPIWIDDSPTLTAEQISQRVTQLKADGNISLVIIDYVQIVSPADPREPREQQVATIARAIRSLAKEVKLPFIVLSQLNDEGKLRESRVIAHEAHNVILLEMDKSDNQLIKMKVCKGRRIQKKNYEIYYEPQFCKMGSAQIRSSDYPDQNK